jgi:chemotaxis response regulator CheB
MIKKKGPMSAPDSTPKRQAELGANRDLQPAAFPIVGIGASAGGLEAIEQFLKNVSPDSGMAYVIIQHLDPTHESIMPELLRRFTGLSVLQAEDSTPVKPDCVYTIPPHKDISILGGVLHLFDFASPRGLRMPIDFFFRSLAEDRAESAVGVILSGTGTDGSLGLAAIKGKEGIVLVQEPSSAKFDGMPRSAIATGLADMVAPAGELPGRITEYRRRMALFVIPDRLIEPESQSAMDKILILLRLRTGSDFSLYKMSTLHRRVERRMGIQDRINFILPTLRAGESSGARHPLQGAPHRRHDLLP